MDIQPKVEPNAIEPAEVLYRNRAKIASLWEMRVRQTIQASRENSSIVLQNRLNDFLDYLVVSLRGIRYNQALTPPGMSTLHGAERAATTAYSLPQLIEEFSILREVIVELLQEENVLIYPVVLRINRVFDSAMAAAADEFVAVHRQKVNRALMQTENSNRELEHFAQVAAHDLKSPLNTISGFVQLLEQDRLDPKSPEAADIFSRIVRTCDRMAGMIDSLLHYAKLSPLGKDFELVSLNEVLAVVRDNLQSKIESSQARIIAENLPTVPGKKELLVQLLQNLVSNAIKYRSSRAPEIQITNSEGKHLFLVGVHDNGQGFDPRFRREIFQLYKRLPTANQEGGLGIGLASCRRVVHLHGGRIWARSRPGQGSSFCFTIPKQLPP